jgi:hypothetical protein
MKRHSIFAGAALGCLAASIGSVQGQGGVGSVMREARVTQIVKDVKIHPAQAEPRPATTNDTVRGDTAVRTGVDSRAELTFGDLTIARLGANTIFSFNEASRTVELGNGAILLRVPKGSAGTKIQTAAVTAAITGTTVIAEYHPKSYAKYLVLEGTMRIYLKGILGESVLLHAGQMMILNPNATRLSEPVDFDLERLLKTSLFIQGFRPLPSVPLLAEVQQRQLDMKAAGELIDTNLVIFGRGTLVTLTDPQSSDVIDRKIAAVTLPTPTIPPPPPTPTATATPTVPPPTPTATATPTSTPKPSKFGTPPPIVTSVPYPIDNGTTIQTDPDITRAGVTDIGKIYRDAAQDGPFSAWAFTATSAFDNTVGIDALYGGNVPVAAFKFAALQLVGNPTISLGSGGAINLALISVGPMTSAPAGNTTFTFTGMQSVLLATQNGSIDLSGISFQNMGLLFLYARGPGSNLTLGAPVLAIPTLRLFAENNIQVNAAENLVEGPNGGTLIAIAGSNLAVNASIDATTGLVPASPATFSGAGGIVSLSALGGAVTVNSRIQVSSNDPSGSAQVRRSDHGGIIGISSGLTTGTGISLSSSASLLSLLNAAAVGPGGSITLTTPGSDIVTNGATIQADRGTITIQHTAAASAGTGQITLNGGTITSETLLASSRGDLMIGTTTPVNLFAVTLSLIATNNFTWNGGNLIAAASASSGNVTLSSGNDLALTAPVVVQRSSAGVTNGLDLGLTAGRNLQTESLNLSTDGSGLTSGGNITVSSGAAMTIGSSPTGSVASFQTAVSTADQTSGSNITITAVGPIKARDLSASVQLSAGRTLGTGGNITLNGSGSFTSTQPDAGLELQILNSPGGIIGTGGNISLKIDGAVVTAPDGAITLRINNAGAQIQTGANITSTIGGNLTAGSIDVSLDNSLNGFIGSGAGITFNVAGATNVANSASFSLINFRNVSGGAGDIDSNAFINVTLADANFGNLTAFIDNTHASIGPSGGDATVTLQINGNLAVTNRIDVFGDLTVTGSITANQFSVTNANAPSINVGAGGITRFTFPTILGEVMINPQHTITATTSLFSTGGINFNGPDVGTTPGDRLNGGLLTLNVPSLTFGGNVGDNIQGTVTFNGGGTSNNPGTAGDGGTFTVNATGAITVNSPIEATSGQLPSSSEPSGAGGTVNLNSTGGTISVNAPITVSSAEPATGVPRRHSRSGGNINLNSNSTGVAIDISSTGQLLSLLESAAPGPGGKITILATAAGSQINVNGDPGSAGKPPLDTIRADRGLVDIRNTGDGGLVTLNNAQISADTVKIGALGSNGTLTIGGGRISADTLLQLYATGSNGSVVFVSDVTLAGNSLKIIAGNTVTVKDSVVVQVSKQPADVYVSDLNHANYSNFNGGNNSTTGVFIIEGTSGSPVSGANTHTGVPPPPLGGGH